VPFNQATMLPDAYYPGRGVFFRGSDVAHRTTSAVLSLTVTGKNSTAGLPDGVAPLAVVAGARYRGGELHYQRFDFAVAVP
jgi:hypothetical protein